MTTSAALPATREDIAIIKAQCPALASTIDEMIAGNTVVIVEQEKGVVTNVNSNSNKNR